MICSAPNCKNTGTLFDGSTVGLIACPQHEEKWRKQMIDSAVSCVNNHTILAMNPKCVECNATGFYFFSGAGFCINHAPIGSLCSYVSDTNDFIVKIGVHQCHQNHKVVRLNNSELGCWCGEKLKNNQ